MEEGKEEKNSWWKIKLRQANRKEGRSRGRKGSRSESKMGRGRYNGSGNRSRKWKRKMKMGDDGKSKRWKWDSVCKKINGKCSERRSERRGDIGR